MRISDLDGPVTASKADWLQATDWIGFTPTSSKPGAVPQCQSTINRQAAGGYILEYITENISEPNARFRRDPEFLVEAEQHSKVAGKLVGVHRLITTPLPLEQIIGVEAYARIQDMWAQDDARNRWSVAFPIVRSYSIPSTPRAKDIFGEVAYRRLYAHASATLRPMNDDERAAIAHLEIEERSAANEWILHHHEFEKAEGGDVDRALLRNLSIDLNDKALEGRDEEGKRKLRRRAAWLANRFVLLRRRLGALQCDHCKFDPVSLIAGRNIAVRSLFDVHHKHPLSLGTRMTRMEDFALLCPTCHRFEHRLMSLGESLFDA